MAAIKTLCLTSLFLIVSRISALQTGNAKETACESSDVTINFIFNIGNDSFADRLWYKNSNIRANRIARVIGAGSLTVEPQYSGRIDLNGSGGIILYNVTETDSGSYLFIIVTDISSEVGTATTTVNVYVNPNDSCRPNIKENSANSFICEFSDACPAKDSIQAVWADGSVGVFTCPSKAENTEYKCCAKGDPVTYCNNGGLCTNIECKGTKCQLELGLALGLGLGIPCVITIIDVGIIIYTSCKYAYILGLVLDLGLGVTFQVGWIIIVSLISKGSECKLELGLGLGLSSGMLYVISGIVSVIFMFFIFSLCKGIPNRVELGKGILTGFLLASVIGIILVYLKYDKLKREPTCTKHEDNPPKPDDHKSKTKNSGHPTSHLGKNNKVDPNTNSKQANDRQQPVPPVNTAFEDTPKFRPLPQRPQNGEIKDQNLRGRSATIDDTPGLANETSRNNILPPLTLEPKKKRKKNKKKDQRNEKTPEDENSETIMMVD